MLDNTTIKITKIDIIDQLYNVLMEEYNIMLVNNMEVETLHPDNPVAKKCYNKDKQLTN